MINSGNKSPGADVHRVKTYICPHLGQVLLKVVNPKVDVNVDVDVNPFRYFLGKIHVSYVYVYVWIYDL